MSKICFVTYHNWRTKRHGGFHQFARYCAEIGNDVIFFSFSRPYHIRLMHDERLNKYVLKELTAGKEYKVGKGEVINVTWPTLAIPVRFRRFMPYWLVEWAVTKSFTPFTKFKEKWLEGTDCFVFESCDALLLAPKIKLLFPDARLIYRPSDPMWELSADFHAGKEEKRMIELADKILTVNEESIEGYMKTFPDVYDKEKFICIFNGVDLAAYKKNYPKPDLLRHHKTACYIGGSQPDWNLIETAARALPDIRFVVITPYQQSEECKKATDIMENIHYIPGIYPEEVPQWITNCDIVIQPYPRSSGLLDKVSLGLTAQNYKAMAAGKPIVTHGLPLGLKKYGPFTSDNADDFIKGIKEAFDKGKPTYNLDLNTRDWQHLCRKFIDELYG